MIYPVISSTILPFGNEILKSPLINSICGFHPVEILNVIELHVSN